VTAPLYRAMNLWRQGKQSEARDLFSLAAAKMKPLPRDEKNPTGTSPVDELITWITYKEAKGLLDGTAK
jgi:hypothetical protein